MTKCCEHEANFIGKIVKTNMLDFIWDVMKIEHNFDVVEMTRDIRIDISNLSATVVHWIRDDCDVKD